MTLAPIAVAVEVRALDTGPRLVRAFRLADAVAETGLRLEHDLPFEAGRPVSAGFSLPDDLEPLTLTGVVSDARVITFTSVSAETRRRLARYVIERLSQ